jgi:hypothetical protein
MRTNATSFAAALFLATSAAILSGCGKTETQPPPQTRHACARPGIPVTVFVAYDAAAGKATTVNKTVYLCEEKDWVEWASCDGDISENIKWTKGSPFPEAPKHDKKVLKSKPPKKGTAGSYPYEATLVLPGGKEVPIDPIIEVMD